MLIPYLDPRLADRLCLSVCVVIVKRLASDILGVKHGVTAFVIQFLESYYNNAATCFYMADRVLVVRDGTALRI